MPTTTDRSNELLTAAQAVLAAREDQMLTAVEWNALAAAVASAGAARPARDHLPIVERALANRIDASKAGNHGTITEDGRRADLAVKAAYVAAKAHGDMGWLRDKLSEAIERVEMAENTRDAYMAMSWLRTSLWDDIQAALSKLEAYDDLLR